MCTVSWLKQVKRYTIFFNRDERKSRSQALPPSPGQEEGVRFLAPTDPDGAGSWIGTNEYGFSCCLLNQYQARVVEKPDAPSRGLIVKSLLSSTTQKQVLSRLKERSLEPWRPFYLLLFDPDSEPLLCSWNGFDLNVSAAHMPFSSSSFDTAAVIDARMKLFPQSPDEESLMTFHSSHEPERGPYSVCMHRKDAETVSFSRIAVGAEFVEFDYIPASPCRRNEVSLHTLRLGRCS